MTQTTAHGVAYDLEFERPLIALERQISELELQARESGVDLANELQQLRENHTGMLRKIYDTLSAWNTVRVARHPGRPQADDYLAQFVQEFTELKGDRLYGEDPAIVCGFGRIGKFKVLLVAHRKGKDFQQRIDCHFGCAHPEGYRKAMRCMKMAEKFGLPIVTLVDTPGAYPGIGAEERGQAEAIAVNLREMSRLRVPIVSAVIGEGGSGGALGIGVADRIAMMRFAWYSVISPEGCAAILWKTGEKAAEAAKALKLTAPDNLALGTIDEVIEEPLGGAHRHPHAAGDRLERWLLGALRDLQSVDVDELLRRRYEKLRKIGSVAGV